MIALRDRTIRGVESYQRLSRCLSVLRCRDHPSVPSRHRALGWNCTAGRYWLFGDFVNTGYNHNGTPNDRRPTCGPVTAAKGGAGGLDPPRSFHPGVVNLLFGDGHVEPVHDSISQAVWSALGTYNFGDSPQ